MARPIATAVINLDAGTADFILKMKQAGATVKDFGDKGEASVNRVKAALHGVVPEQAAASAAIRALEGNPGIRAAERFLSTTLGLRGALTAAFPVIGAIAFLDILSTMSDRARTFFKELQEGSTKSQIAFLDLNTSTRVANDTLGIATANLNNQLAKLQGRPENGLKVALLESKEAADKLGESLQKDLKSIRDLLEEKRIGLFNSLLSGKQYTGDLDEPVKRFEANTANIRNATATQVDAISANPKLDDKQKRKQIDDARKKEAHDLIKEAEDVENEIGLAIEKIDKQRDDKAAERAKRGQKLPIEGIGLPGDIAYQTDERRRQAAAVLANVRQQRISLQLQNDNADTKGAVSDAKANAANSELGKPYDKAIANLKGRLAELNTLIESAGKSDAEKTIARGLAESAKEAAKLNEEMKKVGGLSGAQRKELDTKEVLVAQTQAREKLLQQADEEVKKSKESVEIQRLLAGAIGGTYEAAREAAIQIELVKKFGESINSKDPRDVAARARVEQSTGAGFNAEHKTQAENSIFLLKQQADTQEALTAAVAKGAGAVRLQAQIEKEADLIRTQGVLGLVAASASRAAFIADEKKDSEQRTQTLKQEAEDIRTLSDAYGKGADAIKDAQLKIKQAGIARNTPAGVDSTAEQKEAADNDKAQRQAELAKSAGDAVTHYHDQLEALVKQRAVIEELGKKGADQLGVAIALKQNTEEQNRLIREQVLAIGSARDGVQQFFKDMATDSESAAKKIHDNLTFAVGGINDQLAKALTGQKTSWKSFFDGLNERLTKQGLESLERLAVGGLSGKLGDVIKGQTKSGVLGTGIGVDDAANGGKGGGIGGIFGGAIDAVLGGGGKRDGSSAERALYVKNAQTIGDLAGKAAKNLLSGAFPSFGGFFADGGDVSGGNPIVIGERGPELFIPHSAGTIVPNNIVNSSKGSGGGATVNNYIDARGSDAAQVERGVIRAQVATHNAAVANAVRVMNDRSYRVPRP